MKKFKSGTYKTHFNKKRFEYKSFAPCLVNREFNCNTNKIISLLTKAERLLGELNAFSKLIPDIEFFIKMHVIKEATKSSKIEGTQTGIEEAVLPKKEIDLEKRDDWIEVQNYIKTINSAIENLHNIPLCMRLLKQTHKILLSGARGQKKSPGEVRKSQNWIGGANIENAVFIPPHQDELAALLSDLENFWHNKNIDIPDLLRLAISHYQFETIHPFSDGNGRIGRLLITLQLVDYKILDKPTLYISDFFERNKGDYYDSLTLVRQNNDLEQWIKFFLTGVILTAKSSSETFKKIIELREKYENIIRTFGRLAERGGKLLLIMFSTPVLTIGQASKMLKVSYNSINRIMSLFLENNLVVFYEGKYKTRYFILNEYMNLFL